VKKIAKKRLKRDGESISFHKIDLDMSTVVTV